MRVPGFAARVISDRLEVDMGNSEESPAGSSRSPFDGPVESRPAEPVRKRKSYSPPRILVDGDVRSFVLGGSPGTLDSGSPGLQKF